MTAALAAAAVASAMAFFLVKSRRNYLRLPELPGGAADAAPGDVTVIIPARNEETRIGAAVRSFADARVLVVDDGSSDGTAAEAAAAGAEVIAAPPPPAGWLGKPHACWTGARHSATEWLLFADADTRFRPGFLAAALEYAQAGRLDVLSVFLQQERRSVAERILLPYAFALYFCGVDARAVNSGSTSEALANGQCLLFRRAAYERLGGHRAVASSVIEDVALARAAKRTGLVLRVVRGERHGSVRMYDSLASIWRGFQKNSFRFLAANPKTGLEVIAASVALTSYLPALALLASHGLWLAAAALAVWPAVLLAPWYGSFRGALWAPVAIYLFQAIALDGMLTALSGRKAVWKGREV